MDSSDSSTFYGADTASRYDQQLRGDEDVAATFLQKLAAGGPALEFAIGTGRIALPLIECGVEVHGIELSTHMVEQLRGET